MSTEVANPNLVTFTIDGIEVQVPKGTLVIRAAEQVGIEIPRFCDHPLLDPVAACRQCMVEIPDAGNGRPMKPQPSCALTVMPNMKVETGRTNPKVAKEQAGMLEFLLINHPLDCPICDKGGECPLQNQSMSHGAGESRYEGVKRTYPKPVHISAEVLLDRERCVLCQRCTRFSEQISGDEFISLAERGGLSQINVYASQPYQSYFAGNIIQICPVGALTSADYRFQSRPFDLVSTTTTCEHCAAGCELRTDHRHYQVKRRMAGNDPEVNQEWNCDKGRFGFYYGRGEDRITTPMVRRDGALTPASWPEALDAAVAGLRGVAGEQIGVLTGGRLTLETAYGYSRFARAVLGTNNIDFRSRPASPEEADFLAQQVAGAKLADAVTYAKLESAKRVVLVCFEPEDESPIVFLRLRHAWRKKHLQVLTIAPYASNGSVKMGATLVPSAPGDELAALQRLQADGTLDADTIVLVGERAATVPGLLSAIGRLGVPFAWIPRRAGEVGAIKAGCLPDLLPGGRPVSDAAARVDLQAAWGIGHLPDQPGRDAGAMLSDCSVFVVAGVQVSDFAEPDRVRKALTDAQFVLSLEQRMSEVTEQADVVLPVALMEEQAGTFLNWENRPRRVALVNRQSPDPMTELRVLAALADALGSDLGMRTIAQAQASFQEIADWEGATPQAVHPVIQPPAPAGQGLRLASWRVLIDRAAGLSGSTALLETAPQAVARVSARTAGRLGVADGAEVQVTGLRGDGLRLPVQVVATMVDDVVWVPANSQAPVADALGVLPGGRITVQPVPSVAQQTAGGVE